MLTLKENKANNIEKAIAHLETALKVTDRNRFPQVWAMTRHNLGEAYTGRISGNKADNIEKAISYYEAALEIYKRNKYPEEWAGTQNSLGNAYCDRIKGNKAENIEKAISYYEAGLTVRTRNKYPEDWATSQKNLGGAYCDRIEGNKADNVEQAIACYEAVLEIYTHSDFPRKWASIQNDLGIAYSNRIKGTKAENIEKAISYYKAALEERSRNNFSEGLAMTQLNLGTAYEERIFGDKAENIEQAIACYEAALEIFTHSDFPQKWADIKHNLGTTYIDRIFGDKTENIEKAISYYEAALGVTTRNDFPQKWASTQSGLGNAYYRRIEGDKPGNIEKAISYYKAALKVRTPNEYPEDWAGTQQNLGLAYNRRIKGTKAKNIEKAIVCFKAALKIYTRNDFPQYWALTTNNLGTAYKERILGDKAENLERAIAYLEDALEIYTRYDFPQTYAETLSNLGFTYQDAKRFNEAYTTFEQVIETIESLRDEIISGGETKQKQAEIWNQLYLRMVKVCLELKEETQAIEYAERSKTRNLVELILERDSETIFPLEVVAQLEQLRDEIATGQYQIQNGKAENPQVLGQHLQQLRKQRNELQNLYLAVGSGFKFDSFKPTLDERTAIIAWYIIDDKILAFIIKPTEKITVWQSEVEDLEALNNWRIKYLNNYENQKDNWQDSLEEELKKLASILHINEILAEINEDYHHLILIPHRFLHLLPLHALPVVRKDSDNPSCILDLFDGGVSYAPSCQILQQLQQRKRSDFQSLFAIQNPTEDLDYADLEVKNILPYFNSHKVKVLSKEKATKTALYQATLEFKKINYLHFSCHGYFNLKSPQNSFLQLAGTNVSPIPANANPEKYLIVSDDKAIDLSKCLTLGNLFEKNLDFNQTRLVVLSACETGLIDFNNTSDEYIGLPSGFIYAGGSSVISSLWKVNELSTSLLLIKLIQMLKSDTDISVPLALNQAQLWLRDATKVELREWVKKLPLDTTRQGKIRRPINKMTEEKPFNSPYHWAAFTAVGK